MFEGKGSMDGSHDGVVYPLAATSPQKPALGR